MSGLSFPRPAGTGYTVPPLSHQDPSTVTPAYRIPPNNFSPAQSSASSATPFQSQSPPPSTSNLAQAQAAITSQAQIRAAARLLRQPKTPFITKKKQASLKASLGSSPGSGVSKAAGKQRDLSNCTVEQLTEMLEQNEKLLGSTALPNNGSLIRSNQIAITSRIKELTNDSTIRQRLADSHIDGDTGPEFAKLAEVPGMEGVEDGGEAARSPTAKQRFTKQMEVSSSPNSLTTSMSLVESIERQRAFAQREKDAVQKRQRQMEVNSRRPVAVGDLLKEAMAGGSKGLSMQMSDFMFQDDSEDEEEEEAESEEGERDDDDLHGPEIEEAGEQQHDQEEMDELNPLRNAYLQGWNRSAKEDEEGG